mmetsp:Transcript_4046/g.7796  ORF Transcript_4046/g.7796 Transcript_4046/m.7796 type:complete len:233 (+) Transcript_4046:67-765(+)|eukprot:CAMPEP_0175131332 /NCGR_PEP_ID=MMETSP0087-20121206/6485_1 /TAXON_ID=136419 /ORGANISM="Unknown Unknown, Strain D1" /LENGTH=232 /DNA_ID=CAMNT_0016413613 /DNA_START=61 /DNA_END=759 /DNA_ORIENTATION=-
MQPSLKTAASMPLSPNPKLTFSEALSPENVAHFRIRFAALSEENANLRNQVAQLKLTSDTLSTRNDVLEKALGDPSAAVKSLMAEKETELAARKLLAKAAKKLEERERRLAEEKQQLAAALVDWEQKVAAGDGTGAVRITYSFFNGEGNSNLIPEGTSPQKVDPETREKLQQLEAANKQLMKQNAELKREKEDVVQEKEDLQGQLTRMNATVRNLAKRNTLLRNEQKAATNA